MFYGKSFLQQTYKRVESKMLNTVYLFDFGFFYHIFITYLFLCVPPLISLISLQVVMRQRDIKVKEEGYIQFKLRFITFSFQFPFHICDLFSFRDSQSEEGRLEQIANWLVVIWVLGRWGRGGGSDWWLGLGWNLGQQRKRHCTVSCRIGSN